jgi:predicted ABC-type ATPase
LLSEVLQSIERHETFALESTLSGKTCVRIFEQALSSGFELELHYLWLSSVEQAPVSGVVSASRGNEF